MTAAAASHLTRQQDLDLGPWFQELLAERPLHHEPDPVHPFYVVSRYDDVTAVLRDDRTWQNRDGIGLSYQEGGVLGGTDDPDHARHRKVLGPVFLPRAVEAVSERIERLADGLIADFVEQGEGDFVALFAFPFPAVVLAELMGIPAADRDQFKAWSMATMRAMATGDRQVFEAAADQVRDYVESQVDERGRVLDAAGAAAHEDAIGSVLPADLLSHLLLALRDGRLSRHEVRGIGQQLLVAGHETTTNLLTSMLYRLLQHPDVLSRLREDPGLIESAVEETLRFDSPVQGLFRTNACPVHLHDTEVPERSKVQAHFAAANRDPRQWKSPDVWDIDRDPRELRGHLAFGRGKHACIGASLARLEARVAFERLLGRLTDLQAMASPTLGENFLVRGFPSFPIRWTPVPTAR